MTIGSTHFEVDKENTSMVEYQIFQGESNRWEVWQYNKKQEPLFIGSYSDVRIAINWVRRNSGMNFEPRIIFEER